MTHNWETQELERKLSMSLAELDLSAPPRMSDPNNPADELTKIRNFDEATLREVKTRLAESGLLLGMPLPTREES